MDEVAQGHSEIGIIYLNNQNQKGIMQRVEKLGLEVIELIPFQTHIYLREGHPLAKKKELVMEDLVDCQQFDSRRKKMSIFITQRTSWIQVPALKCLM